MSKYNAKEKMDKMNFFIFMFQRVKELNMKKTLSDTFYMTKKKVEFSCFTLMKHPFMSNLTTK